jgi:hypothetical protein
MIDGAEIIAAGTATTPFGTLIASIIVLAILVMAFFVVGWLAKRRGDIALALVMCIAVLIVTFNPIMELFTYKRYVVKVSDSVTISELTSNYIIMEQKKDGTLVLKEKRSNGKS